MKLRIEFVGDDAECEEVVIRCRELTPLISELQKLIAEKTADLPDVAFYRDGVEYFFPISDVLFFETDSDTVYAHTVSEAYKTEFKLYELQKILPPRFIRVSKSTIANVRHILSINKNLTSSSLVQFHKSHKQVYVSRMYYKDLKHRLISERY